MILVDTSAWIEYLRDTNTDVCNAVDGLLGGDLATCEPVSMELLAGARDERHLRHLKGLLARATMLQTLPEDYELAASLYRTCRGHGEPVRKLIDCLIGAVALRNDAEILHADRDYLALARHCDVRVHQSSLRGQP